MSDLFNLGRNSKIYVLCPANNKTGGTELLHQLVYELNRLGRKAFIVYYFEGKAKKNNPIPEEFKKYIKDFKKMSEIYDSKENLLILPEVCIGKQKKFNNIQKCIWWLSVDNYKLMKGKVQRLKRYGFLSFLKHLFLNDFFDDDDLKKVSVNLYQSYFAKNFIKEKGVDIKKSAYLSDYINDVYIDGNINVNRKNIVIYNPKKGFNFTKKLIAYAPDIKFIPIENMTNIEVRNLMQNAKVYIDFGNHPGKDRIPREATISGCCLITNKRGSAGFYDDVPIKDKYKFDDIEENIPSIISLLRKCISNYNEETENFSEYRRRIKKEKFEFRKNIENVF